MSFGEMFVIVLMVFVLILITIRVLWSLLPMILFLSLISLVAWGLYKAPSVYNNIKNWGKDTAKGAVEFIENAHDETTEEDIIDFIDTAKNKVIKK